MLAAGVAGESDREPITVVAPAVDEPIGTVPRLGETAVQRARRAHRARADRPAGERGAELAREIECDTVNVNDAYAAAYAAPGAPMGGLKDSGIGHRQGPEGLYRYVDTKTIGTSRVGPIDGPSVVPARIFARATLAMTRTLRRLRKALR